MFRRTIREGPHPNVMQSRVTSTSQAAKCYAARVTSPSWPPSVMQSRVNSPSQAA